MFAAFILSAWWYIPNLRVVVTRLIYFTNIGGKEGDPTFLTFEGWAYYTNALLDHVGLPILLISLISFWYLFKRNRNLSLVFLASIILIYTILTFLSNKDQRYILPLLPLFSVSVGLFIGEIYTKRIGKILLSMIVVLGLINVSAVTLGQPTVDNKIFPNPNVPKQEDWKIDELLEMINSSGGNNKIVVVLPDHIYLNGQSLEFYRLKSGYSFAVYNGVYIGYETFKANFQKIDYIVLIEPRSHEGVYSEIEESLYNYFYDKIREFKKLAIFDLPDRTSLLLYKRI